MPSKWNPVLRKINNLEVVLKKLSDYQGSSFGPPVTTWAFKMANPGAEKTTLDAGDDACEKKSNKSEESETAEAEVCLMIDSPYRMHKVGVCLYRVSKVGHCLYRVSKMAAMGLIAEMDILYQKKPSLVSLKDPKEWTPLHHAAAYRQPEAITFLCNRGADLNARDLAGRMPIHVATERGAVDAVIALIDK
ncbi:Ankyrin repeat-containing domain [Trinorchestia longiramus]|nr:Ankyrin repeat-containing domain [Trinorchestia longiramus]